MILSSKEKEVRLQSLTEKESPFRIGKTQQIFKNTANLSLKGTTYDAKHLDKFLNSSYGYSKDNIKSLSTNKDSTSKAKQLIKSSVYNN